jgi:hypothetical protein
MKSDYILKRVIAKDTGYDVVVAGGGPAGTAAAIRAARLGKRVTLIEATGSLGGMGTNGLVSNWYSLSDGEEVIVKGLFWELVSSLARSGNLQPGIDPFSRSWQKKLATGTGFNPEGLKILLDRLCEEAGVDVRFGTRLIDVDTEGSRIKGVITHSVEGYQYIPCLTAVDATGDAILSDLCGVRCLRAGKDTENIMPPTLCALLANIDFTKFSRSIQQEALLRAIHDGYFTQPDRHVPGIFQTGASTAIQNSGHLFGVDALDTASLSEGYRLGRKLAEEYKTFARKYLSGCEDAQLISTAALLGVRESRRVQGMYMLSYEDFKARRHFSDQIGIYNKAVDIHVYDTSEEQYQRYLEEFDKVDRLGIGESYGLPYRMLVPEKIDNMWVAGRCASSDVKVNGAIRDQPACYLMGEAAGAAAVQAIDTGKSASELSVSQLQDTLRQGGSHLPESKQLT